VEEMLFSSFILAVVSSPQYLLYGDMLYPVSAMCLPLEALVTIEHSK
jgi:hypothetical protein